MAAGRRGDGFAQAATGDGNRPADVAVAQGGRALLWLTDAGDEVDLDADALRLLPRSEQAAAE